METSKMQNKAYLAAKESWNLNNIGNSPNSFTLEINDIIKQILSFYQSLENDLNTTM